MMEELTYNSSYDLSCSSYKNGDISISDTLADFERMRISALTKAAEISPLVTEVTIGLNSPKQKEKSRIIEEPVPDAKEIIELMEDKISDDLRHTLILKEYETKLQESSESLFKNLVENMITTYAETMHRYWKKQSEDCKRKSLELKARKLNQMAKQLRDNDNVSVLEWAKLEEKKCQIVNQQTIENMNRILEEQNKAPLRYAAIIDSHTKICSDYNEILYIMQSDPLANGILEKYVQSINAIISNISTIMDFFKTGTITDKEVKQSEILSINMSNMKKKIIDDLKDVKQEIILKKQKEEEQARQKQLEENHAREKKAKEDAKMQKAIIEQSKKAKSMFYSEKNYTYYTELQEFLNQYEATYKTLLDDSNMKRFRFDCQKAVNTPINALSSVSGMHMKDKLDKLSKLLRGEKVQVLDTFIMATQHPQGLKYCTALLAKKIVRQGDLLVSSNPEAAFPLAAVTVALWAQFPEFGKLLEAYFHRSCPYLVPMLLPQKEGQTDKEFYMSRGYTYNEDGVVEKQDKFLKRMSGIFRLCCAIWIASTPRFLNASNPHGFRFAWQWLSSFLNLKPEPDISATLLHDFFIVCGSQFLKHYGKQCTKIIKLLSTEYFLILQKIDEGGPKTRLDVFLKEVIKTGNISTPKGILSPSTW